MQPSEQIQRHSPYHPYRWAGADFQIGLRPIKPDQWLLLDVQHDAIMREKRERLRRHRDLYYRTLPASLAAQQELRERVVTHLVHDHGARFRREGSWLKDVRSGLAWDLCDASDEPLRQLSDFIVEDFMLIEAVGGAMCITAASNAYSSSGRLVGAVGRGLEFAHRLVPTLTEKLGARIDRVMGSVHVAMPSERFNWQLTPMATLFFPHDAHAANADAMRAVRDELGRHPQKAGELLFIRVERQTLTRLPDSNAVAFSLHTYSDPLFTIKDDAQSINAMLELLQSYSAQRWQYSEMDVLREPILSWLSAAAQGRA